MRWTLTEVPKGGSVMLLAIGIFLCCVTVSEMPGYIAHEWKFGYYGCVIVNALGAAMIATHFGAW